MSKEGVRRLLTKIRKETSVKEELNAALEAPEDKADVVLAVARKHGCDITFEESREVVVESGLMQLDDDDLDKVAGGLVMASEVGLTGSPLEDTLRRLTNECGSVTYFSYGADRFAEYAEEYAKGSSSGSNSRRAFKTRG